ncbi:hypothetical protein [Litchfieldella qijiaojingensis]|uniref:hypothetical protein n=1 Tax=Litchfieldella qijiaojingensis TaxID=980347 RepID=UPI001E47186A|nr:hypothetical protein [Halomonas qijiaojingensis]
MTQDRAYLTSLGLGFLGALGIVDAAQPLLDGLAERSGELVRLAVAEELAGSASASNLLRGGS